MLKSKILLWWRNIFFLFLQKQTTLLTMLWKSVFTRFSNTKNPLNAIGNFYSTQTSKLKFPPNFSISIAILNCLFRTFEKQSNNSVKIFSAWFFRETCMKCHNWVWTWINWLKMFVNNFGGLCLLVISNCYLVDKEKEDKLMQS